MDYPVSDALKDLLDRKRRGETAGTVKPFGKKRLGAATDRMAQQVPAGEGCVMHGGGVQEMNLRQYAQRKTRNGAHWLKLIVSR